MVCEIYCFAISKMTVFGIELCSYCEEEKIEEAIEKQGVCLDAV